MNKYIFVAPSLFLFGALLDGWPYAYFQLLRWTTTIAAAIYAVQAYNKPRGWAVGLFLAIVVLFNPLATIHATRQFWIIANGITGVIFVIYGIWNLRQSRQK